MFGPYVLLPPTAPPKETWFFSFVFWVYTEEQLKDFSVSSYESQNCILSFTYNDLESYETKIPLIGPDGKYYLSHWKP